MNQKEIDKLNGRIAELESEASTLQVRHDQVTKQFQQIVSQNQTRYAQIQGAIIELKKLKGKYEPDSNGSDKPPAPAGRIPRSRNRTGGDLGPPVVHRDVDKSDPTPG